MKHKHLELSHRASASHPEGPAFNPQYLELKVSVYRWYEGPWRGAASQSLEKTLVE